MFKKFSFLFLLAGFCICLSTVTASADIIYSDLGNPPTYDNTANGYGVLGSSYVIASGPSSWASEFLAGGTGSTVDVTQIDVTLVARFGASANIPANFQVFIWQDSNGLPSGSPIYTSPQLTATGVWQVTPGLVTVNNISGVTLNVGTKYFISASAYGSTDDLWWDPSSVPTTGLRILQSNLSTNNQWSLYSAAGALLPGFDILGSAPSAVPVPPSIWILGSGLLGLIGVRRKFKS